MTAAMVTVTIKGREATIPETAWIGWKDGEPVAWYLNSRTGDTHIRARNVEFTTPAANYRAGRGADEFGVRSPR
jgi:hypothetical protein